MSSPYILKVLDYLNTCDKISAFISTVLTLIIVLLISIASVPVVILMIIGPVLWLLLYVFASRAVNKIYERMCNCEVDAVVNDIHVDEIKMFSVNGYNINLVVEYEYNGKNYIKTVKLHHTVNLRSGSKIKLKICKTCPGIIRYEQKNK